ncbi:MAG: hypothetical protein Q9205_006467, partial [Flavoplaca limonia]
MRLLIIVATILFANFAAAKGGYRAVNFHEQRKLKACFVKFDGLCGCDTVVAVDFRKKCNKIPGNTYTHGVACRDIQWEFRTVDDKYYFTYEIPKTTKCSVEETASNPQAKMRPLILLATFLFASIATANWEFDLYSKRNGCKLKIDGICGCHATVTVDSR